MTERDKRADASFEFCPKCFQQVRTVTLHSAANIHKQIASVYHVGLGKTGRYRCSLTLEEYDLSLQREKMKEDPVMSLLQDCPRCSKPLEKAKFRIMANGDVEYRVIHKPHSGRKFTGHCFFTRSEMLGAMGLGREDNA